MCLAEITSTAGNRKGEVVLIPREGGDAKEASGSLEKTFSTEVVASQCSQSVKIHYTMTLRYLCFLSVHYTLQRIFKKYCCELEKKIMEKIQTSIR